MKKKLCFFSYTMSTINFYSVLPKKYQTKLQTYKNYDRIRISLPFRMLIIGSSGAGKTNLLLNIIQNISAWNKIALVAKNTEEPLYQYFIDQIQQVEEDSKTQILTVGNSIDDIPDVDSFSPENSNLLILDDLISEKESKLQNIRSIFIRGRKQNLSTVFLSQSYFKIPLMIRQNSDYIILKKIASIKDLIRISSEYSMDKSPEDITRLYKKVMAGADITKFFMIDLNASDPRWRYRANYTPVE